MESFIYVVAASPEGPCKIGYSADPDKRLKQLQTGHATTLKVYHREPVTASRAKLMETVVHKTNRHHKLKGEWFRMSVEDAILEIRHAMIRHGDEPDGLIRSNR